MATRKVDQRGGVIDWDELPGALVPVEGRGEYEAQKAAVCDPS